MKPVHFVACVFATACGLLDLVAATHLASGSEPALCAFLGLACGQLAVLTVWSLRAPLPWLLRMAVPACAAALMSDPLARTTAGNHSVWFLALSLFAAVLALLHGTRHWLAVSLSSAPKSADRSPNASRSGPFQFSLCDLLSVVTLSGILFGLTRLLTVSPHHVRELFCYAIWLAAVSSATCWALAGKSSTVFRLVVLVAVCLLASVMMDRAGHSRGTVFFAIVVTLEAVVVALGIQILALHHPPERRPVWPLAASQARRK